MKRCLICGLKLAEGESGYHSKCRKSLFDKKSAHIPVLNYSQEDLNDLAKSIIMERISVPGVQPKLSLHLEHGNSENQSRLTLVGLEGDYILKPQTPQWSYLPEAEHFAMLFAWLCSISVAKFGLIPLKSGELAYITRRMDRTLDGPLHMEDFCQLTNKLTSQKYNGSMEQVGKALRTYSSIPGLDAVRLLELTLFCFLTGNSDMHLKNFSMIRLNNGNFELTPAYDLVPVKIILPEDKEELALTLCGKKSNIKVDDFRKLSEHMRLTEQQFEKTKNRLLQQTEKFLCEALKRSFMPDSMKNDFKELFSERFSRMQ